MRIAVIADIHGNLPALEAILADIRCREVDRTINLGDCVSGPLWPREVCDLVMARDDLTVRGNHDRWVSGPDPARMGASDRYAYSQLNQDHRSWLGALPASADVDCGILVCHGTRYSAGRSHGDGAYRPDEYVRPWQTRMSAPPGQGMCAPIRKWL